MADRVRDPLSVAMLILAAVLGSFVTFVVRPSNSRITAPESIVSDAASVSNDSLLGTDDDGVRDSAQLSKPSSGENAIWLNMRFVHTPFL